MNMTLEELERFHYIEGNLELAELYAKLLDAQETEVIRYDDE